MIGRILISFWKALVHVGYWLLAIGSQRWAAGCGLLQIRYTLFAISYLFVLACSPKITKQKGEYLLGTQVFKGNKTATTEELELLLPQKPNRELASIPGFTAALWVYHWQEPRYSKQKPVWKAQFDSLTRVFGDTMELLANEPKKADAIRRKFTRKLNRLQKRLEKGNGAMQFWGSEAPVYFRELDAKRNTQKMKDYLVNNGYFSAKLHYTTDTLLGRIRVTYHVNEGLPSKLRYVNILTQKDPDIDSLLRTAIDRSLLKAGDRYSYKNIQAEVERIEKLMTNNGYFGFSNQYLRLRGNVGGFLIDTNVVEPITDSLFKSIDIKGLQVTYPRRQSKHTKYVYDTPRFAVIRNATSPNDTVRTTTTYRDVVYDFQGQRFSPRALDAKILMRHDSLVRKEDLRETQFQLSLLDQFEYIKINDVDTLNGRLKPVILVQPFDKFKFDAEPGLSVVQGAGGFSGTFGLKIRNIAQSLGNLNLSLRGAYDQQIGYVSDTTIQTLEFGMNASMAFPRILFFEKWAEKIKRKTPRTIVSLDYNFANRLPDFKRKGGRASMIYTWRKSETETFSITPIDVSYIKTDTTSSALSQRLQDLYNNFGNPLIFSFQRQSFVSSISAAYRRDTYVYGQNKRANYLALSVEAGGLLLNLLPKNQSKIETYRFLKLNADYREHYPLGIRSSLVFRGNVGLLVNYGANRAAPYEKYLTAGGSNSMRAWRTRRMGLGAAYPSVLRYEKLSDGQTIAIPRFREQATGLGNFDDRFEQLGDVLIETNAEFRARLFRLGGVDTNYALFLDIGNVWTLSRSTGRINDNNTQNALFRLNNFYKQLAVSTGFGLRLDFSYFLIRADVGIKAYDPARIYPIITNGKIVEMRDERFVLPKMSFNPKSPFFVQPQIGIGYPF